MNGRKAKLINRITTQIFNALPAALRNEKTLYESRKQAEKLLDKSPKTIRELKREFGR